jgi:hypothetical protein
MSSVLRWTIATWAVYGFLKLVGRHRRERSQPLLDWRYLVLQLERPNGTRRPFKLTALRTMPLRKGGIKLTGVMFAECLPLRTASTKSDASNVSRSTRATYSH